MFKRLFALIVACVSALQYVWAGSPTTPEELTYLVHSPYHLNLFWKRSTDDEKVVGYELTRNGELIGTLDSLGLYEFELMPGVVYTYTVTAIDNLGNRSGTASISLTTEPASTPTNAHIKVYSDTAAELFWDRAPSEHLITSTEIQRDGIVIGSAEGNSFFDDNRERGVGYQYAIVPVNLVGQRSEPAIVTSFPGPSTPESAHMLVYSDTAAELFWDRAPEEEHITSTEVRRNGAVIGTAEGNSFFDDTRESATYYQYVLTAINSFGLRSDPVVVPEMPFQAPAATINRDNHVELLEEIFSIYQGRGFNKPLLDARENTLLFLSEVFPAGSPLSAFPLTHNCRNGGTALFPDSRFNIEHSGCQVGSFVFDGSLNYFPMTSAISSTGVSITDELDRRFNFSGTFSHLVGIFNNVHDLNYKSVTPDGEFELQNGDFTHVLVHLTRAGTGNPNFLARLSGEFTVRSRGTSNQRVRSTMQEDFLYSEPFATHMDNWNFRSGVLQLIADDGSELILDADTGDDSSVSIKIIGSDETEEFIQPWSLWRNVLLFD